MSYLQTDDGGNHSLALLLRGKAKIDYETFKQEIMDVQNRHGGLFIVCPNPWRLSHKTLLSSECNRFIHQARSVQRRPSDTGGVSQTKKRTQIMIWNERKLKSDCQTMFAITVRPCVSSASVSQPAQIIIAAVREYARLSAIQWHGFARVAKA